MRRLDRIQETEEHDFIGAYQLAADISEFGFWIVPIAIECSTLAITDSHHRLNAAKLLNCVGVPCVVLDYERISVTLH